MSSGFKLALRYKLRPKQKLTDTAYSNNLAYKKVWPIREEITAADALAFRTWVEGDMKAAGRGGSKARDCSFHPPARTSARVEEREERDRTPIPMPSLAGAGSSGRQQAAAAAEAAVADAAAADAATAATDAATAAETAIRACRDRGQATGWGEAELLGRAEDAARAAADAATAAAAAAAAAPPVFFVVPPAVIRCVDSLKTTVERAAKAARRVEPSDVATLGVVRVPSKRAVHRMQPYNPHARRPPVNRRNHCRQHRSNPLRKQKLAVAAAAKAETSIAWLQLQVARLSTLLATRDTAALLPEGDYSEAQLDRVHRQALVLRRYYELLAESLEFHERGGEHFAVYDLAAAAGQTLGDEHWVWHSAVRRWSAEYIEGAGVVQPDGRGHYTRELLVLEEARPPFPAHTCSPHPFLTPSYLTRPPLYRTSTASS